MTENNYTFRITIFSSPAADAPSDCKIEISSNTLDDKPTINDILTYAKAYNCSSIIYVNITIDNANGEYIDSDEFVAEIDYENNKITIFN